MKKILIALSLILFILFPSCDDSLTEAEGNINEFIYPYLEFELSDTLTYYTATVVAGADLSTVRIPGEYHTDFGTMPVEEFAGFANPEDAAGLKELILDHNVQKVKDNALDYATNLETVSHVGESEEKEWAYLPKMSKKGHHFIGWKSSDVYIWQIVDGEYKQITFTIDPESSEAVPVFVKLSKVDRKEATCTEDGNYEYYYCEDCGKMYSDEDGVYEIDDILIPSRGHHLVHREYIAPTCETPGQMEHYHCEVCGLYYEDKDASITIDDVTIDIVDHKSDEEYHKNDDSHWFECIWCDLEIGKEDHKWNEGVVEKEPTANEDGLRIYTCTICGHEKEEILTDHEHIIGDDAEIIPATCTEDSFRKGICTVCGRDVIVKAGERLGHDLKKAERIEPDCENKGVKNHFHCSRCNLDFTNESAAEVIEELSIPALGHKYKTVWSHDAKQHWKVCERDENHKTEPVEHIFDRKAENPVFLKEQANCEHGVIYYISCECGEKSMTETFEVGEPLHRFEKEDGTPNYAYNADGHWIECVICNVKKDGTSGGHSLEKEGANKICTICPYLIPGVSGGFSPEMVERDPRGELIQVSRDGNIYTFRIVDKNEDFPITSYEWETSGVAIAGVNESTFSFEAPGKKTYSVRCIFSNVYGVTSLSATVSGGEEN